VLNTLDRKKGRENGGGIHSDVARIINTRNWLFTGKKRRNPWHSREMSVAFSIL
jgi:hypothetical protein